MESIILAAGLILFAGTAGYNAYQHYADAEKTGKTETTVQVEKNGHDFLNEDKKK